MLLVIIALVMHFQVSESPYTEIGMASYYASSLEGHSTSSGEIYWHEKSTAAHRTLPFGTRLKVENLGNGKTVVVKVNDRGPFVEDRVVDLSRSAFEKIAPLKVGVIKVKITVLNR